VVNIADPRSPYVVASLSYSECWGVAVNSGFCYIATWWDGLRIIDISNPSNPFEVGYYGVINIAQGVAVYPPYIFVTTGAAGIQIYQNLSAGIKEEQGKFFSTLSVLGRRGEVKVSLFLTEEKFLTLSLFDSNGRMIKNKCYGIVHSGKSSIFLDMNRLPFGLYFLLVKLREGGKEEIFMRKFIYLGD